MIYDFLKTAFPIVMSLGKQNRYVKPKSDLTALLAPQDDFLPFIMTMPTPGDSTLKPTDWIVYAEDGTPIWSAEESDLLALNVDNTTNGFTHIWYWAGAVISISPGSYYLGITYNGAEYFSEVFRVDCFNRNGNSFLKLEWDNNGCDLGPILYQTGFKNLMFLDTVVAQESPIIEEEGYEDGINDFFPTQQKYVDNLSLEIVVPFFMADALLLMTMHKRVTLTTAGSVYTALIKNMKGNVSQQDGGHAYIFKMTFQQDTKYLNTACCNNMTITPCLVVVSSINIETGVSLGLGVWQYPFNWTNSAGFIFKFKLEYSLDDGETWVETTDLVIADDKASGFYTIQGLEEDTPHKARLTPYCDDSETGIFGIGTYTIEPEPECIEIGIETESLPYAIQYSAYYQTIPITGTGPFSLSDIVKPDWVTSVYIDGNNAVIEGYSEDILEDEPISFTVSHECSEETFDWDSVVRVVPSEMNLAWDFTEIDANGALIIFKNGVEVLHQTVSGSGTIIIAYNDLIQIQSVGGTGLNTLYVGNTVDGTMYLSSDDTIDNEYEFNATVIADYSISVTITEA